MREGRSREKARGWRAETSKDRRASEEKPQVLVTRVPRAAKP
jgi:hypothetical protein